MIEYVCCPRADSVSGRRRWEESTCQKCGDPCWSTPESKTGEKYGRIPICNRCAIEIEFQNIEMRRLSRM